MDTLAELHATGELAARSGKTASAQRRPIEGVDRRARFWMSGMELCGWPALADRTVEQARNDFRFIIQTTSIWQPVRSVGNATVVSPQAEIPVRIYLPLTGTAPYPVLVWVHGGGFTVGDLQTADPTCRSLANRSGAIVVSVDYRLAPEHGILDAVDDAYAATLWAMRNAAALSGDPGRVAVGGDSAGGTLAALVCLCCRDNNDPPPALQVLVYPSTDFTLTLCDRSVEAPFLDWATIDWFGDQCLRDLDRTDPRISPYHAKDHRRLPSALVLTAGADLLCPDGEAYAERLRAAGVPVSQRRFDGQIHGFFSMDLAFPEARRAHRFVARSIAAMPKQSQPADAGATNAPAIAWTGPGERAASMLREVVMRAPPVVAAQFLSTIVTHRLLRAGGERQH